MRTTIDLPDDVHRKAKSDASLKGMKFKEYATALFRQGLVQPIPEAKGRKDPIPVVVPAGRLKFPEGVTNADLFEALDREDDAKLDEIASEIDGRSA